MGLRCGEEPLSIRITFSLSGDKPITRCNNTSTSVDTSAVAVTPTFGQARGSATCRTAGGHSVRETVSRTAARTAWPVRVAHAAGLPLPSSFPRLESKIESFALDVGSHATREKATVSRTLEDVE